MKGFRSSTPSGRRTAADGAGRAGAEDPLTVVEALTGAPGLAARRTVVSVIKLFFVFVTEAAGV